MSSEIGRDRYEVVEAFFKRPKGWTFVDVADVAVDADDNVFVFCRGSHPVMVFDRDGHFLDAWGEMGSEHFFTFPHGITVGLDGFVYTADSRDHTIRKFTREGRLVLTLGRPHLSAPALSGQPFNRPSHATVARNGDIYVSDGHGNDVVHCFSPDGELKFSFGGRGQGPGQFNLVHSVYIDPGNERLYVTDRYNNRIQSFTLEGAYLGEWGGLRLPQSVRRGPDGAFYVAELAHRITVLEPDGTVRARWGDGVAVDDSPIGAGEFSLPDAPSRQPLITGRVRREPGAGLFAAPHGIAVDSAGSIYVAEAAESFCGLDRGDRSIQKFVRV